MLFGGASFHTWSLKFVSWSGDGMMGEEAVTMDISEDELGRLDIDLGKKSKQHNLTSSNVRTILHVSVVICVSLQQILSAMVKKW